MEAEAAIASALFRARQEVTDLNPGALVAIQRPGQSETDAVEIARDLRPDWVPHWHNCVEAPVIVVRGVKYRNPTDRY